MAVKVVIKETGETVAGKFAVLDGGTLGLFSGIMSDKKHTRLYDTFWRRHTKGA